MPTTLDCELLRDLYGTAEVRAVFESRALLQAWLEVETALAAAEAEAGVIPAAAARRIAAEANASYYDLDDLRAGIAESKHPLVPLIRALAERCGEEGAWVHWGVTTQDVIDTALVLQVRSALRPIDRDLDRACRAAVELARRYAATPMPGRTHGQHAVPITFGLKAATWADELIRARGRLERAGQICATAQLSGAAGTLATLGGAAEAVQQAFCHRLGLGRAEVPWHATRDRLRDLGHALSEISAGAERIGGEVIRLQSTEIAEVAEPSTEAHVGSSTMPQKSNPMTCEYMIASARLARAATGVLVDTPAHAHERDMSSWAAEWIAVPQALILTAGLLDKLAYVLEGLEVDERRMRENLRLTRGGIMAESVMMELARAIGHERAHQVILAAYRRAERAERELSDVLAEDPAVTAHLSPATLAALMDPVNYLGLSAAVAVSVEASLEDRAQ
jgi:adenylosuccinate lyase/3-carboxy-cis,cis-muconate cycloisomerase